MNIAKQDQTISQQQIVFERRGDCFQHAYRLPVEVGGLSAHGSDLWPTPCVALPGFVVHVHAHEGGMKGRGLGSV
ncbi:hypothetical protein CEXT_575951 [Caerostris extrusa]|uniref:Uncharacterized protein n=1 Tax=Caerostris extrusa TaxID=172846 RepID=A0AAV4WEQ6_CAEEX|nr:hypothetical protein CEXT_575951 [Caerostris extrusa]